MAWAASSGATACMHRKSSGHSRRKQGLHSTWWRRIVLVGDRGPVNRGSVDPKTATSGIPRASARCIVPVSLVRSARNELRRFISSSSDVFPARFSALPSNPCRISSATVRSFSVPTTTHEQGNFSETSCMVFRKRSAGQRFAGPYSAPGQTPSTDRSAPVRTRGALIGGGSTAPQRSAM